MAIGGSEFGYEDLELHKQLDEEDTEPEEEEDPEPDEEDPDLDDKDPKLDVDEQGSNTTQPFEPGTASTPYQSSEDIKTQTRQHENTGLPDTSFDEDVPLMGDWLVPEEKQSRTEKAMHFIRKRFPKVGFRKLGPIGLGKEKGNETEMVVFGPRLGEEKIPKRVVCSF